MCNSNTNCFVFFFGFGYGLADLIEIKKKRQTNVAILGRPQEGGTDIKAPLLVIVL